MRRCSKGGITCRLSEHREVTVGLETHCAAAGFGAFSSGDTSSRHRNPKPHQGSNAMENSNLVKDQCRPTAAVLSPCSRRVNSSRTTGWSDTNPVASTRHAFTTPLNPVHRSGPFRNYSPIGIAERVPCLLTGHSPHTRLLRWDDGRRRYCHQSIMCGGDRN